MSTELSMGINDDKAAESPPASSPKAAPTAGGVTAPGASTDEGYPGIAHDFESCKAMLREALKYIGECPHHVFKDPKAVVAFYERATVTVQS